MELERKLILLDLADDLGNVALACRVMGFSRDSFYRFRQLIADGGVSALTQTERRKSNLKNRVGAGIEQLILDISKRHPSWGKERVAKEVAELGHTVSASGVRSVWMRYDLETAMKRRIAVTMEIKTNVDQVIQELRAEEPCCQTGSSASDGV